MRALFCFALLAGLLRFRADAAPINDSPLPWPPGTVLYHASAATLTYVSPKYFDKQTHEDRMTIKLNGEWQFNSRLHGAHVSPQAGVVICSSSAEELPKLTEFRALCTSLQGRRVDVYIYASAVNKDHVTYAGTEQIKIVAYKGAVARWHQ